MTSFGIISGFHSSSSSVGGKGGENYERVLVQKLLADYDTAVRPSKNISIPLNVTFGLALTQIIDVVSIQSFRFQLNFLKCKKTFLDPKPLINAYFYRI